MVSDHNSSGELNCGLQTLSVWKSLKFFAGKINFLPFASVYKNCARKLINQNRRSQLQSLKSKGVGKSAQIHVRVIGPGHEPCTIVQHKRGNTFSLCSFCKMMVQENHQTRIASKKGEVILLGLPLCTTVTTCKYKVP